MSSHRVLVIGTGYVGLTTAACLVDLGHRVTGLDIDETKVERLARGEIPIYEQGLSELVESGLASGRLSFTTSADAVGDHDIIMLCLPTPAMATGGLDLSAVRAAIGEYRTMFKRDAIVVTKSTVPLGTYELLQSWISRSDIHLVSNPEFLREGSAVADFMHPDRIVVGAESS